jgi:hypothetical protein
MPSPALIPSPLHGRWQDRSSLTVIQELQRVFLVHTCRFTHSRSLTVNGTTCHTGRESMAMIQSFCEDMLIYKDLWPPLSPDLLVLNFFSRGFLKE